jgi:hypothetical protein
LYRRTPEIDEKRILTENMLKTVLFIFLISSTSLFGQRYSTNDILKKADSIMISAVGLSLFNEHFQLDSTSYCKTRTTFNDEITYLTRTKSTNGKIKLIAVRYTFYLNKFEQPSVSTSVIFDKDLNLKQPLDTAFIPKFILQQTASDFLTKEDVVKIASDNFAKKGIKPIESFLTYDPNKKSYLWTVTNTLSEWIGNNNEVIRQVELLEINAITGEVVNFYPNALQAPTH